MFGNLNSSNLDNGELNKIQIEWDHYFNLVNMISAP